MAKAKTKAPALDVPQTDEHADFLLECYGDAMRELALIQADMSAELAAVKAKHEASAKPFQDDLNSLFERLQAWGEAHRKRLTEDETTKTVKLPAGEIGWRMRPPSVSIRKGLKLDDVVARIKQLGLRKFLRVKVELNKDAMLEEPKRANTIDGVAVGSKGEEFFVAPFGAEIAEPKT